MIKTIRILFDVIIQIRKTKCDKTIQRRPHKPQRNTRSIKLFETQILLAKIDVKDYIKNCSIYKQ